MPISSRENEPSRRRVLNLKALAILAGGGTLLWMGMNYLHAAQVVRTSEYLKQEAEKALADEDHHRAFDLYEQYTGLNSNDSDAEEKISVLLEEHGNSAKGLQRAFQINERLLREDRTRDDLRLRQIRIADRLGRYSDASVHLRTMRNNQSKLADVWHFSGIVAKDTGKFDDAEEYFRTAVDLPDANPESFELLADILTTESQDLVAAEGLLERLVEEHDSAEARRIRAAWYLKQDRPTLAIQDLWTAIVSEPANLRSNAMLLKAVRLAKASERSFDAEQQYKQLVGHLRHLVTESPDETRLRLYLSSALWAVGNRDRAIQNLEDGIERDPREMEMHEVLVDYLVSDRRYERAQEIFDRIPARAVDRGRREFMRGRLLMSQKDWPPAIESFEMALGFASQDPNMASRARICLALCRRENGDDDAAMDAYRSLIQANPDFEGGRLGMASAYLRADQVNLAIAEYRQLLHVDGVPEFLANLMIKNNLTLPKQSRDWSEVERILSDKTALVKDGIQRSLLQADLLFAKGFPSQAMDLLDDASRRMPNRPEFTRAYQRLSAVHGDQLLERIRRVMDDDPMNREAHASILRLYTARKDNDGLTNWMDGLASNQTYPTLSERQRLEILAETTTTVADAEQWARGETAETKQLLRYGQEAWRRLAAKSPQHTFHYIQFLARHRRASDAMTAIDTSRQELLPDVAALCWLEVLRQHPDNPSVRGRVNSELMKLIRREPANMNLRLSFVDNQLLTGRYAEATSLLRQLVDHDGNNGRAYGRLAWLAAVIHDNPEEALENSNKASRFAPGDESVRSIRGLSLALAGNVDAGLKVLEAIPENERSTASYVFEARVLSVAGRRSDAYDLTRKLSLERTRGNLIPAEQDMLRLLQEDLQVELPQLTRR